MLRFILLEFWELGEKNFYVPFHTITPKISRKSRYIFVAPGWIEYRQSSASSVINSLNPSTSITHNLPWFLSTLSSPWEKDSINLLRTVCFNSINRGWTYCLDLTTTVKDNLEMWRTMKPPFSDFQMDIRTSRWTPKQSNLGTSFTNYFLASTKWVTLHMETLLKASTTTLSFSVC